ncbi:MAG: hypothetical protein IPM97_03115 [Bdellovibrionaceae bacterium]|nr:hypothetical protein [Pseudobdellovibrionaceae bacterium]
MKMRHMLFAIFLLSGCALFQSSPDLGSQSEIPPVDIPPSVEVAPLSAERISPVKAKVRLQRQPEQLTYVGLRGYLSRPPKFSDKNSEKSYERCEQIEITSVYQSGQTILVNVKQKGRSFSIVGINRKDFTITDKNKVPLLDRYFVKALTWVGQGRQTASNNNQKTCAGQAWKDMPKEQFQFVSGDPEYRRPLKFAAGQYDVWTYGDVNQSNYRHYYFLSDRLYSWTQ